MTTTTTTATALSIVQNSALGLTIREMVEVPASLPFFEQWERLLDKEKEAKERVKSLNPKACLKQLREQLKVLSYLDIPFSQKEAIERGIQKQEDELKNDYKAAIKRLRMIRAAKVAYKAYAKYVS